MLIDLIQTYGLQHYDAYHREPDMDYNVLCREIDRGGDTDRLLDENIGTLPRQVFWLGAGYTPMEFAHSVCTDDEYTALTSFTHHPYGQRFPLEVPNNRFHDTFLNVPLDTMMHRIVRSLREGHPVCWEGDASEPGFLSGQGFAVLQDESLRGTPDDRRPLHGNHRTGTRPAWTAFLPLQEQLGNRQPLSWVHVPERTLCADEDGSRRREEPVIRMCSTFYVFVREICYICILLCGR